MPLSSSSSGSQLLVWEASQLRLFDTTMPGGDSVIPWSDEVVSARIDEFGLNAVVLSKRSSGGVKWIVTLWRRGEDATVLWEGRSKPKIDLSADGSRAVVARPWREFLVFDTSSKSTCYHIPGSRYRFFGWPPRMLSTDGSILALLKHFNVIYVVHRSVVTRLM